MIWDFSLFPPFLTLCLIFLLEPVTFAMIYFRVLSIPLFFCGVYSKGMTNLKSPGRGLSQKPEEGEILLEKIEATLTLCYLATRAFESYCMQTS